MASFRLYYNTECTLHYLFSVLHFVDGPCALSSPLTAHTVEIDVTSPVRVTDRWDENSFVARSLLMY